MISRLSYRIILEDEGDEGDGGWDMRRYCDKRAYDYEESVMVILYLLGCFHSMDTNIVTSIIMEFQDEEEMGHLL